MRLQKVRISEANSLSGAGEEGTSDAYAAALWTVDISFEFAAVGIQSLHFHFGHGGLPGNSVEAGVPVYAGGWYIMHKHDEFTYLSWLLQHSAGCVVSVA
jgi:hypothetical protein